MYARAELDDANAALWSSIRQALERRGIDAPVALDPNGFGYPFWEDPNMLLSQTCGYPYRIRLANRVGFVGTLDYGLPDCPAGYYYSVFVVGRSSVAKSISDLTSARFAFNSRDSQSGYVGPMTYAVEQETVLRPTVETGAHWASAKAVAEGRADVAAIDAITWRHMSQLDSFTGDLRVLDQTPPVPGLPLITGQQDMAHAIRVAVTEAVAHQTTEAKPLGVRGVSDLTFSDYTAVAFGEASAE